MSNSKRFSVGLLIVTAIAFWIDMMVLPIAYCFIGLGALLVSWSLAQPRPEQRGFEVLIKPSDDSDREVKR